jgi:hypothetical protein
VRLVMPGQLARTDSACGPGFQAAGIGGLRDLLFGSWGDRG